MIALITNLITGGILGGLTGVLGTAIQRFADYKTRKLDLVLAKDRMAHEIHLRQMDQAIMEKEWEGRVQVAATEATGAEAVAEANAFSQSYQAGLQYSRGLTPSRGQAWALISLDLIRGLVRPALTVFLIVITTFVYFQAQELMGRDISEELAGEIVQKVIGTILYLTTTCITWWFGTRNSQKPPEVLGGKK